MLHPRGCKQLSSRKLYGNFELKAKLLSSQLTVMESSSRAFIKLSVDMVSLFSVSELLVFYLFLGIYFCPVFISTHSYVVMFGAGRGFNLYRPVCCAPLPPPPYPTVSLIQHFAHVPFI
jgi:hypothetical protein